MLSSGPEASYDDLRRLLTNRLILLSVRDLTLTRTNPQLPLRCLVAGGIDSSMTWNLEETPGLHNSEFGTLRYCPPDVLGRHGLFSWMPSSVVFVLTSNVAFLLMTEPTNFRKLPVKPETEGGFLLIKCRCGVDMEAIRNLMFTIGRA